VSAALVLVLLPGAIYSLSEKKIPPHVKEDIAQPWIGISEDELDVVRLDLRPEGKGWGAYVFVDHQPQVFRITSWTLERYSIEIRGDLKDLEDRANNTLKGTVVGFKMQLTMSGEGWRRKLWLRPENAIEPKLNELQRSIDAAERGAARPGGKSSRRAWGASTTAAW
jgi:hypothetical protein